MRAKLIFDNRQRAKAHSSNNNNGERNQNELFIFCWELSRSQVFAVVFFCFLCAQLLTHKLCWKIPFTFLMYIFRVTIKSQVKGECDEKRNMHKFRCDSHEKWWFIHGTPSFFSISKWNRKWSFRCILMTSTKYSIPFRLVCCMHH